MTGSPKDHGWKTKEEFVKALQAFGDVEEVKLSDKNCGFLVTDSMSSTSSKMKDATKKGVKIETYASLYKSIAL